MGSSSNVGVSAGDTKRRRRVLICIGRENCFSTLSAPILLINANYG